jgi:hypothetical protein
MAIILSEIVQPLPELAVVDAVGIFYKCSTPSVFSPFSGREPRQEFNIYSKRKTFFTHRNLAGVAYILKAVCFKDQRTPAIMPFGECKTPMCQNHRLFKYYQINLILDGQIIPNRRRSPRKKIFEE